jgi:hypothetical protein
MVGYKIDHGKECVVTNFVANITIFFKSKFQYDYSESLNLCYF